MPRAPGLCALGPVFYAQGFSPRGAKHLCNDIVTPTFGLGPVPVEGGSEALGLGRTPKLTDKGKKNFGWMRYHIALMANDRGITTNCKVDATASIP